MIVIRRRLGGEERLFNVWTKAEADQKGLTYVHWRDARPGEWGLSDDAHVAECLRIQEFRDSKGRVCRVLTFPYARIWDSHRAFLSFADRAAVCNWSATSARSWVDIEARRSRTKNVVKLYVVQRLSGKVDWEVLGKAYRPDQLIPAATLRRLMKQPRIRQMIDEVLEETMSAHGWSVAKVADEYLNLIEQTKAQGDMKNLRLTLEHLTKLLDMMPLRSRR